MRYRTILLAALLLAAPAVLPAQSGAPEQAARLFQAGRYAEARRLLSPGADQSRDARVPYWLGRIAFAEEQFENAAEWFTRATRLAPRDAEAFLWLGNAYSQAAIHASMLRQPGLGTRAREAWEAAARLDPRNIEARENLMTYYAVVPGILGGSLERSAEYARQVQAINPYRGGMALADISVRRNRPAEALATYQRLAETYPDSTAPAERLVHRLAEAGRHAEAFSLIDQRLRRAPNNLYFLYHLGRTAGLSGERLAEGAAALNRFLAAPLPANFPFGRQGPHFWLGRIRERQGDARAALGHYQEAQRLAPRDRDARAALERVRAAGS